MENAALEVCGCVHLRSHIHGASHAGSLPRQLLCDVSYSRPLLITLASDHVQEQGACPNRWPRRMVHSDRREIRLALMGAGCHCSEHAKLRRSGRHHWERANYPVTGVRRLSIKNAVRSRRRKLASCSACLTNHSRRTASPPLNSSVRHDKETCLSTVPKSSVVAALLLHELNTSESMARVFFGERILVDVLYESDGWYGKTCGLSRFAPTELPVGTEVLGPKVSGHYVISAVKDGDDAHEIFVDQMQKGGAIALMYSPRGQPGTLVSANPFCPNEKCVNVCSLTYRETCDTISRLRSNNPDLSVTPAIEWGCNLCGARMIVTETSFDHLYKS